VSGEAQEASVGSDGEAIRVLYVIDSLRGGGAENSLAEVAGPLLERGVCTTVVTLLESDHDVETRLREVVEIVDLSSLPSVRRIGALDRLLRHGDIDVVHSTLFFSDVVARPLARLRHRAVVTSIVNEEYTPEHRRSSPRGWTVRVSHALDAGTAQLATRFHAISHSVADTMSERLHVARDRIDVVYRGRSEGRLGRRSDDRRREVRGRLDLAPDVPVVLCVARLDKQKGVDLVIEAHRRLRTSVPEALLLVAGEERGAGDEIRALAGDPERTGVILLGHRSDVPDLMCAADALAVGSRWEGLGGTVIEAIALELPIVMTDLAPLREVTADHAIGVIRDRDPDLFAIALERALSGGDEVRAKVQAGRRRFEEHFTIDAAADGMCDFYERALAAASPGIARSTSGLRQISQRSI
jgi:glycosyltransferase involved in cell wall biosynthesis